MLTGRSLSYSGWVSVRRVSVWGSFSWGVSVRETPSPCGQTDRCKNITFPQLRLRAVTSKPWSYEQFCLVRVGVTADFPVGLVASRGDLLSDEPDLHGGGPAEGPLSPGEEAPLPAGRSHLVLCPVVVGPGVILDPGAQLGLPHRVGQASVRVSLARALQLGARTGHSKVLKYTPNLQRNKKYWKSGIFPEAT